MKYRLTAEYMAALRSYLRCTKDWGNLYQALKRDIVSRPGRSMLDIGAGNGDLSLPLSNLVLRYVAVESNQYFAERLQKYSAQLEVVNQRFPYPGSEKFDIVLAAHVVPQDATEIRQFLRAARERLRKLGTLITVIYDRDRQNDWGRLIARDVRLCEPTDNRFAVIMDSLLGFGAVEVEDVITHVESKEMSRMMNALSFAYGEGVPARAKKFFASDAIRQAIRTDYRQLGRYSVPVHHKVIEVKLLM